MAVWQKLAVRINEIFEKNEADAVVITHGTDTREETSYFLDLTVHNKNAVVITGSMCPATGISADGFPSFGTFSGPDEPTGKVMP